MLTGTAGVSGVLKLSQNGDGPTKIVGSITGLTPGKHGLHVHEFGDTTNGCMSTGPHFNPNNMDHGAPTDKIRHAGDLGNVEATAGGCDFTIEDMQIPLSGANSIIGRAFVIHELEDDLGRGDSSEIGTQGESRRDVERVPSRTRAREREERETDGTTFPHVFFPVERKNFQNHRKRRRAFGVWNRRKGKKQSLVFSFFSFLFFSFLFFSSKTPSRIVETRRDSPKNLDSRSSRRERKSDSSETSLHARHLLCKTHRSRNTARNKLYEHTARNRRGVPSPFVSCETTSHDSKTSPRLGPKRET